MTPFRAPLWAANRHVQTVWSTLFRRMAAPTRRRETLELPDGDFIELDHVDSSHRDTMLVVLLHGLGGSGDSSYITGMQHALQQAGLDSVAMWFRGAGGQPNRLARGYHGGYTGDLAFLLDTLATRFPGRRIAALGYSLGGNILLKYLGERGNGTPLCAAVSVCAPLSLADAADTLDRPGAFIYRRHLLRSLLGNLAGKRENFLAEGNTTELARLPTPETLAAIRTLRGYDDHVIAPLHGFRDADDYYAQSSCGQFLAGITVPTLLVHALDDPFMTQASAPHNARIASSVEVLAGKDGGHVGFVQGTPWRARWWLEEAVPAWLRTR